MGKFLLRTATYLLISLQAFAAADGINLSKEASDFKIYKSLTLPSFPGMEIPVYRSRGKKGPAILMIHGNSSSSRSFVRQYARGLGNQYKVFLVDLPGFGRSSKVEEGAPLPTSDFGVPVGFIQYQLGLIEAIATVANDPEVNAQILVGWSLGGDLALLTHGAGLTPRVKGLFIFGTSPAGANPPTAENPFLAPAVPGVPGLQLLPSIGFAFQFDPTSPLGFNLSGRFTDPVPPYAPAPIAQSPSVGDAYVRAFFNEKTRLKGPIPQFFIQDAFERSDWRARASIGALALGLVPPGSVTLPDELDILANLDIPVAIAVGEQDAFVNQQYLEDLKEAGRLPTLWKNEIIRIKKAGHAAHYERHGKFNAFLRQFVNDLK